MTNKVPYVTLTLLLALLVAFLLPADAQQPSFCAVRIRVALPRGTPARGINVSLLDETGKEVAAEQTDSDGEVEFCDFDFGKHMAVVNPDQCNERRIANLEIAYGIEQVYHQVIQPCLLSELVTDACGIWIRVLSSTGAYVPDAIAQTDDTEIQEFRGDNWGRITGGLRPGVSQIWRISADGFEATLERFSCTAREITRRTVVLSPVP